MSATVSVSSWLGQWAVSAAAITTLLSVTTVLNIAVTLWQDMMRNDTMQHSVKHTDVDFLQIERDPNTGASHADESYLLMLL